MTRPDERVLAAAPLSAAVKAHLGELEGLGRSPVRAFVKLVPERGLYVQVTWVDPVVRTVMIFWDNDPRADAATRRLSFDQKWELFRDWLRDHPSAESAGSGTTHVWFARQGVELDPRTGSEPSTGRRPRRADEATRRR